MPKNVINLQEVFLNQARKDKIIVTVFLTNGFQFKGIVKGFDIHRCSRMRRKQISI